MLRRYLQPADAKLDFRYDISRPEPSAARNSVFPIHPIDGISAVKLNFRIEIFSLSSECYLMK